MDRCSHASDEPSNWTPDSDETTNARELCLRNSDLLEEILGHILSASDRQDLQIQRQAHLWIALTCRDFLPSAIKILWRRLDNLLPLLRLLPSFSERDRDGVYYLCGPMTANGWTSFDCHAKHVREIVYHDIPDTIYIEPSVYFRLGLRNSPILPNVWRFACSGTTSGPSASETLLYMQLPLRALELGSMDAMSNPTPGPSMEMTRAMVVSSLREKPSQISHLILVAQPVTIFDEGIPLDKLMSLELAKMIMNAASPDPTFLRRIGSLPCLRSFRADSTCITESAIKNLAPNLFGSTPSHFISISGRGLFMELTDLRLRGDLIGVKSPVALFLQLIGSSKLQCLTLQKKKKNWASLLVQGEGRGARSAVPSAPILHTISHRWSKSLRQLDLEVYHSYEAILELLAGLSNLCSLKLSGDILNIPVGKSISMFAGLSALETLSLHCRFYLRERGSFVSLDLRSISNLALFSPRLRELDIPISASVLPPLESTRTISLNLRKITVNYSDFVLADTIASTIGLACRLDQMFPRLNSLRYDNGTAATACTNPSDRVVAWAQVQELVLAFQHYKIIVIFELFQNGRGNQSLLFSGPSAYRNSTNGGPIGTRHIDSGSAEKLGSTRHDCGPTRFTKLIPASLGLAEWSSSHAISKPERLAMLIIATCNRMTIRDSGGNLEVTGLLYYASAKNAAFM
ncbi:hypothetical protein GGX14DRAFT_593196 [Mycena pura]|uniref:F-box domain-containing protein n=1 Tax=Mycena pura TaxID=153505 RepID=A0AAD6UUU6_9AGAR|nr:hypothetical protein GGX14DRAFT_593196 [Mycena pura]